MDPPVELERKIEKSPALSNYILSGYYTRLHYKQDFIFFALRPLNRPVKSGLLKKEKRK